MPRENRSCIVLPRLASFCLVVAVRPGGGPGRPGGGPRFASSCLEKTGFASFCLVLPRFASSWRCGPEAVQGGPGEALASRVRSIVLSHPSQDPSDRPAVCVRASALQWSTPVVPSVPVQDRRHAYLTEPPNQRSDASLPTQNPDLFGAPRTSLEKGSHVTSPGAVTPAVFGRFGTKAGNGRKRPG